LGPSALKRIEPFFFGPTGRRLLGCFHAPSAPVRACGLVFCNPLGHEYIKFHRAYRQLAMLLADAGFPVLRFDLRGCGDSAGDSDSWSIAGWLEDVDLAIAELQRRAPSEATGLVGMRLGGALALLAGAARGDVDSLVLWDPVLDGGAWLRELEAQHEEMLKYAHVLPDPASVERSEVLGAPMPEGLVHDLRQLELLKTRRKPARRALVIDSNDKVDQEPLAELLTRLVVNSEVRPFASPLLWAWTEDFGKVHVPHKILREIVAWLSEVYG
jgi:pimeloyl-ACP methyl ester carboxylesterase